MAITAQQVKQLRDRTGLGMMDCKAALQEAGGDLEAAIDALRKKSALKAAKKATRTAAEGLLGLGMSPEGRRGALVEVNIETDFAARNPVFVRFVRQVADAALAGGDMATAEGLRAAFEAERERLVQSIGENISIRRIVSLSVEAGSRVAAYLHTDARKGALVAMSGDDDVLGRDLAMHVTAHDPTPLVVRPEDLDAGTLAREREILMAQASESGKPPEIAEKMVAGRMRKYLAEVSLVEQAFVRDADVKVGRLLADRGASVSGFARLEVGEGIAVDEQDFAAEVAAQAGLDRKS